jgi:DNA adenine methylase
VKPPFTYFGGKTSIADRIAALLPPHEHYVEPFAGSLAVLLAKKPSPMETVNDLDGDLMAFWRVLRDRPAELERVCALTPHSRAEHQASLVPAGDELEQARRAWVRLTQGRSGTLGRRTGWRYYENPAGTSFGMPVYLARYVARIAPAATRLTRVSLECRPALEVVRAYGRHPGCLIYADPPYLDSVRDTNREKRRGNSYAHEMRNDEDHRAVATALRAARAAVVVSGYDSPLYASLYDGWHRVTLKAYCGNGVNRSRTEVLWSNRPFPRQGSLFDLEDAAS